MSEFAQTTNNVNSTLTARLQKNISNEDLYWRKMFLGSKYPGGIYPRGTKTPSKTGKSLTEFYEKEGWTYRLDVDNYCPKGKPYPQRSILNCKNKDRAEKFAEEHQIRLYMENVRPGDEKAYMRIKKEMVNEGW
jgi:hypothetical protein